MLGGQNNKADQLMSSQFLTSAYLGNSCQTCPGYFHSCHRAVNQEVNFYLGENVKPPFLPQYLEPFSIFF